MQFQQPSAQAHYNLNQLIQHQNRHRTEYLQVLSTLQAEKLSSFLTRLLSRVHTESYMAGNSACRTCPIIVVMWRLHNDSFLAQTINLSQIFHVSLTITDCWQLLIEGNITRNEAEAVMDLVEDALFNGPRLKAEPVLPSQQKERRTVRLESGCDWYHCSGGLNEKDMNSAVLIYLQV